MVSIDIDKAFLQGMSYEEIHQETGEPRREVFFVLPPGGAAILRRVRGFEHFDECQLPTDGGIVEHVAREEMLAAETCTRMSQTPHTFYCPQQSPHDI